jgi:hypothetical protein
VISASIASLLGLLHPPSSIATELSALPTSVLSGLEGPNAISAVDQLYVDKGAAWFTALPSGAESWVLGLPSQAVTIRPQVISLQSLANHAVYTPSPTPTLGTSTNDLFPTATSALATTVTATAQSISKRGLTEGQEIGVIVGVAAFLTVCGTLGFMLYDERKKKLTARMMRAAHLANLAVNPRKVGVGPRPLRQSEQSRRSQQSCQSQRSQQSAAELGGSGSDAQRDEIQFSPHEAYEMHTPEIRK